MRDFRAEWGLEEVERPKPSPGRAVVRVAAVGVCYRDYLAWQGWHRLKLPIVPGHEYAGVVEEVGPGVDSVKPGDKVAGMMYEFCGECEYCRSGREYICRNKRVYGEAVDGAFAEYVSADAKSLVPVPDGVPLEAAAFASCVLSTVVRGVRKMGASPGQLVVVTGASGGVGIHALQIAKAYGARTVAVTRPEKAEAVAKYADYVATSPKFSEEVKRLGGADGAVEAVGGPTLEQTIRSVKSGGRIALIGNVDPNPQPIPLGLPLLKEVDILPVISGGRRDLEEALGLLARGLVKPVYSVHRFEEIPALVAEMPRSRHLGRRIAALR